MSKSLRMVGDIVALPYSPYRQLVVVVVNSENTGYYIRDSFTVRGVSRFLNERGTYTYYIANFFQSKMVKIL